MVAPDSGRSEQEVIRPTWEQRIQRAEELAQEHPSASELLAFYARILSAQQRLAETFASASLAPLDAEEGRARLAGPVPLAEFPSFLSTLSPAAPHPVAEAARELLRQDETSWQRLLRDFRDGHLQLGPSEARALLALAYLQPWTEWVTQHARVSTNYHRPTCPACDGSPVVGVLRPEGYGARRALVCALCSAEWDFRRAVCPACGEDRADRLPVFTTPEYEHLRIEACDSCWTYLKTVDLTKFGLAVPVVDEVAAVPLSLWAQEHGYRKLYPNLFGL